MKILYGVQATGNGHITRARALSGYFRAMGVEVDYLFSGRERSKFFDMEDFGSWRCMRGLTFIHEAGQLRVLRTAQHNSLSQFRRDVRELDLTPYDLVLTDFEPITAWAARKQRRLAVGVGHQYAFHYNVPRRGDALLPRLIMRHFAPVDVGLGLHWHHFGQPILPPIVQPHVSPDFAEPNKVVVYLGFEEPEDVIALLEPFETTIFAFYGPFPRYESRGHIQLKPLSREGFQHDLATSNGVICNAGFELASEAIQLGKKLLVKPLQGQLEQLSNAAALEQLQLGMVMDRLNRDTVNEWLDKWTPRRVVYPDVAEAIAHWLKQGQWHDLSPLAADLWSRVDAGDLPAFAGCANLAAA